MMASIVVVFVMTPSVPTNVAETESGPPLSLFSSKKMSAMSRGALLHLFESVCTKFVGDIEIV